MTGTMVRFALPLIALAALSPQGCARERHPREQEWRILALRRVSQSGEFLFQVKCRTRDGPESPKQRYRWTIDWVGHRPSHDSGRTPEIQKVSVRGGTGTVVLRIYADDSEEGRVQLAEATFVVF